MITQEHVILVLSGFLVMYGKIIAQENNVCSTFIDYFNIKTSSNCWYNPDIIGEIPTIIKNHGYPLEEYTVTSIDGYILKIFRIPRENARDVVVLQPPMTGTGASYMKSGNGSLAFGMYEAGFDVWLPHSRGTYYSRKHIKLNDTDMKYWDFSFHEIAFYDFPAELELVKKVTKRKGVIVIGYSMAATCSAIYASILPQHAAEHVRIFILLGPAIYADKGSTPWILRNDASWDLLRKNGKYTVFSSYEFAKKITRTLCQSHPLKILCVIIMISHAGGTSKNFDPAIVPILYENLPMRISLKILQHFKQIGMSGHFQQFDYGPTENLMRYNSTTPPKYNLGNITVPFYIMYGEQDLSCRVQDVERAYKELSSKARKYGKHLIAGYNHFDFIYAKTAKTYVLDHILFFLKEFF